MPFFLGSINCSFGAVPVEKSWDISTTRISEDAKELELIVTYFYFRQLHELDK